MIFEKLLFFEFTINPNEIWGFSGKKFWSNVITYFDSQFFLSLYVIITFNFFYVWMHILMKVTY